MQDTRSIDTFNETPMLHTLQMCSQMEGSTKSMTNMTRHSTDLALILLCRDGRWSSSETNLMSLSTVIS